MSRKYLRILREQRNMTMQDVADKMGITRQYYQQIEAGEKQKKMALPIAVSLSEAFGITTDQIIEYEKSIIIAE